MDNYQIFISYRRDGGDALAGRLADRFNALGYKVFYDVESMRSGTFNTQILDAIAQCDDVLLVLPPNALDRCINADDWVRQELAFALKHNKNIIPIMMRGFEFPKTLPADIDNIRNMEGVTASSEYFDAVVKRIELLLNSVRTPKKSAALSRISQKELSYSTCPKANIYASGNVYGIKWIITYDGSLLIKQKSFLVRAFFTFLEKEKRKEEKFYAHKDKVTSLHIEKGCKDIGGNGFFVRRLGNLNMKITSNSGVRFLDFVNLERVVLPEGFKVIHDECFNGCISLKSVKIPTTIKYIGKYSFGECKSLVDCKIPHSIIYLSKDAFSSSFQYTYSRLDEVQNILDGYIQCFNNRHFVGMKKYIDKIHHDQFLQEVKSGWDSIFKNRWFVFEDVQFDPIRTRYFQGKQSSIYTDGKDYHIIYIGNLCRKMKQEKKLLYRCYFVDLIRTNGNWYINFIENIHQDIEALDSVGFEQLVESYRKKAMLENITDRIC